MARATPKAGKPTSEVQKWLGCIKAYETEFQKWERRVDKILKRYRDHRIDGNDSNIDSTATRFNILWSNVQTLVPACFSRLPMPDVSRRFSDNDPVGRVAGMILERALDFEVQHYPDYRTAMRSCVYDRFLGGRGTAWARYEPHIKAAQLGVPTDGVQVTEDVDTPAEELEYECAPTDYVHWRDFGHTVARTWDEVTGVWRRVFLTREKCVERFGKEKGEKIPLDAKPDELKNRQADAAYNEGDTDSRAAIYEIWNKAGKEILWLSKSMKEILDKRSPGGEGEGDPLEFEEFFPCPRPLYATITNETLVPVPDFALYQDQANELDTLADRIDGLIKALQVKGTYDSSIPELARLFTEGVNGTLIPVKNWMAFAEKNGLAGAISLVDLTPIAKALEQAYLAMEQVKRQVYEITGISDIIRGNTDAGETATAQQIKGQYATLRLKSMQQEVAEFATGLLRLKAEIICTFDPATLAKIGAVDQLSEADQQYVGPAIEMLRNEPVRNFRIEIAADSMVQIDERELKESRVEFLTSIGVFLDKVAPVGAQAPQLLPMIFELLKFGVTAFKAGKQVEGMMDQAIDQMKALAANPQQGMDPEKQKQMEEQAMQAAKAQVAQENATKEIGLNKRAADLDIRELKFAAEQEITKQREDATIERDRLTKEDATKRYEIDKRVETDGKKIDAGKEESANQLAVAKQPALELESLVKGLQEMGQAFAQQQEEVMKAMQEVAAQVQAVADDSAAPAQLQRGPDGRVATIQKGKRKLSVVRGADGRAEAVV